MFTQCQVFVFTLGLTEAWRSRIDGTVYPVTRSNNGMNVGREIGSVPSGLKAGARLKDTPADNPVGVAYELYLGGPAKDRHVADPAFSAVPVEAMLNKEYARARAAKIDPRTAQPRVEAGALVRPLRVHLAAGGLFPERRHGGLGVHPARRPAHAATAGRGAGASTKRRHHSSSVTSASRV